MQEYETEALYKRSKTEETYLDSDLRPMLQTPEVVIIIMHHPSVI
jgi:hypothetical protein